jgi:hypothetical protein
VRGCGRKRAFTEDNNVFVFFVISMKLVLIFLVIVVDNSQRYA